MKYKTVKAVRLALTARGGYLEKILDTELPEYAPHLSRKEQGWEHGVYVKAELLEWANANLQPIP